MRNIFFYLMLLRSMLLESKIPVFPLSILPLPNELVPLHIFEYRYQQLLIDLEKGDTNFGIYYTHGANTHSIGSLVRLESIIKRYDTGESDIVVKCVDIFLLKQFYDIMKPKIYPGGQVLTLEVTKNAGVSKGFKSEFDHYMQLKKIDLKDEEYDIHDVANELDLDIYERLKYLQLLTQTKRENFLTQRLKFRKFILEQEQNTKNNFFLN